MEPADTVQGTSRIGTGRRDKQNKRVSWDSALVRVELAIGYFYSPARPASSALQSFAAKSVALEPPGRSTKARYAEKEHLIRRGFPSRESFSGISQIDFAAAKAQNLLEHETLHHRTASIACFRLVIWIPAPHVTHI